MWDKTEYSFGVVNKKDNYYVTFKYLGTSKVKKVTPSCSCSVATFNDKEVTIKYKPNDFPPHLKVMGIKETTDVKTIKVETENGHEYLLTIKAVLKA